MRRHRGDRRRNLIVSGELAIFLAVVAVVAILGVGIGMLVARPLGRAAERLDEDEGDGND